MSVRKGDRTEGKLQVLNKARILKSYSIDRAKTFPKSTRWLYAAPVVNEIRSACLSIRHANSVHFPSEFPKDNEYRRRDYKYRRSEQIKAHASLDALLDLIEDAYAAHYISGDQLDYWTGLVIEADELLKAWIKSDTAKLKKQEET